MTVHEPITMRDAIVIASNNKRYSILKTIENLKRARYSTVKSIVLPNAKSNEFAYNLKRLKDCGLTAASIDGSYFITKKGDAIIQMLDTTSAKFISTDNINICKDGKNHTKITMCKKC